MSGASEPGAAVDAPSAQRLQPAALCDNADGRPDYTTAALFTGAAILAALAALAAGIVLLLAVGYMHAALVRRQEQLAARRQASAEEAERERLVAAREEAKASDDALHWSIDQVREQGRAERGRANHQDHSPASMPLSRSNCCPGC